MSANKLSHLHGVKKYVGIPTLLTAVLATLFACGGSSTDSDPGTPSTLATATGWNQLTGSPTSIYQQFDTAYTYTGDYVLVTATKTSSSVLTLVTTWFSAARATSGSSRTISGGTATTGITFGTAPTTVVTYFPPETTYLANTWGSTSVASTVSAPVY